MSESLVLLQRHGHVLEIVLNRPKVNAISREFSRALYDAALALQNDADLRVGILTARGDRVFSAGWDFNEALADAATHGSALGNEPGEATGSGGFGGISNCPELKKPLVAAVNGAAVGGGFELALACDIILMSQNAYFQLPEMQRGFLPDGGGVQRLPRRIPHNVAVELMLTGRRMLPEEAERWGLAHAVHPAAVLRDEALALAARIAEGAPLALQALKEVLGAIEHLPMDEAMMFPSTKDLDLPAYRRMAASRDAIEGPSAFLERRRPEWTGT